MAGSALMGWRVERIADVPSTAAAGFWSEWAREPDYGERWHSVGEHLGITGFGVNAYQADAGRELIVPTARPSSAGRRSCTSSPPAAPGSPVTASRSRWPPAACST